MMSITRYCFIGMLLISSIATAQNFTGQVYGTDRFIQSQTTLPSAAIDIPKTPGVESISPPSISIPSTPSTTLQPSKVPLFKSIESWHDPLSDDNPDRIGATPWIRSFLPHRATKNVE